ncbi:hypothetical protein [Brevundimonas sp.]|uniref:hypothetical protein n=1 Tax=Brevundimonas sp. TaxID=1871086 RepID=UPI002FCC0F66
MPMPSELRAYAGRYDSRETGSPAEVTAADGGVAVRFGRGSLRRLELAPLGPDVFGLGSMIARFHRDGAGTVTGFSYSDPLLRSLCFTRSFRAAQVTPKSRHSGAA